MVLMKKFDDYLVEKGVEPQLVEVFRSLFEGVKNISSAISTTDTGKIGTQNVFGEEQLALDVLSDKIMNQVMDENEFVGLIASEEMDGEIKIGDGLYACAYDPLDGSSLVDVNLSIGTIIGIYKTDTFLGLKGVDQVGAMIAVYGPSTTVLLTIGQGVAKFIMDDRGNFDFCEDGFEVVEGKMFAPGNLRACKFREDYLDLVNYWIKEQYTLRYSGGMVPDVSQIILKGKGIFSYPGYEEFPDGKLRLIFECAPMAFLMEQAGGAASDGKMRILEKTIENMEQRTPIFIGSKAEVQRCEELLS